MVLNDKVRDTTGLGRSILEAVRTSPGIMVITNM